MTKSHKVGNANNKVPTSPVDSREALQWFVNNFGLYVGSVRGLFLADRGDEQAVSLEASVVSLRSRGFSPLVVTGETLYKQADYIWQEAREKASFARPVFSKFEQELANNDIVVVDGLEPPTKAHHLWYLLSYLMHPRAGTGKANIFTTQVSYHEFLREGHNCAETDFIGKPVNWEKFIWLIEATTINQELFKLAREESVPPMLKAELYMHMAMRERNLDVVPQHVLGDYLLDFALIDGDRKLNVECDTISAMGGNDRQKSDAQRDLVLMADGWQILRFSTAEVMSNRSACVDVVEDIWKVGKKRAYCGRVLTGKNVPALPDLPADDEGQRAAIAYGGGPTVVIGGSGNGKTSCLVQRTASLLGAGISPESILIVTHNAEALKPLKASLDGIAEKPQVQRLALFSWQDLGLKVLKENLPVIRRKPPLKIDANHQKVIQRVFTKVRKDVDPVKLEISGEVDEFYVAAMISMFKAHLISPKRALEDAQNETDTLIAKIYQSYEDQLLKSNRIDKDDVISMAAQLLLDGAEIRARYQSMFEYVLVDEYQEVTLAQDILIRVLASPQDNLYVTGDEQEAITEHRNACPELLGELAMRLPQARCFVLEKNWRCHPEIVDHARQLTSHLERISIDRPYYSGWGAAAGGAIIGPQPCATQNDEVEWIANEIQAILNAGRAAGEIAILYQHNSYEELIKEALIGRAIRFHAPHSDTSVVPDEVGDMLAYLKLVIDPDGPRAREAFERVSQLGFKEIDPKLSATIASFAEANNLSYLKAVEIYAEATADQSCRELEQCVKIIRTMHMDRLPPGESIGFLRRNRRLNDYYKNVKLPPGVVYEPLKKLQQLEEEARKFSSVSEFVKHMEGRQKEDDSTTSNESVHIKAIADSKGWEFAFVFLPGLAEGLLPGEKSADIEEDRRLCYVAFTRARERLYLSFPVLVGGREWSPSRFIGEARLLPLALSVAPEESFEPQYEAEQGYVHPGYAGAAYGDQGYAAGGQQAADQQYDGEQGYVNPGYAEAAYGDHSQAADGQQAVEQQYEVEQGYLNPGYADAHGGQNYATAEQQAVEQQYENEQGYVNPGYAEPTYAEQVYAPGGEQTIDQEQQADVYTGYAEPEYPEAAYADQPYIGGEQHAVDQYAPQSHPYSGQQQDSARVFGDSYEADGIAYGEAQAHQAEQSYGDSTYAGEVMPPRQDQEIPQDYFHQDPYAGSYPMESYAFDDAVVEDNSDPVSAGEDKGGYPLSDFAEYPVDDSAEDRAQPEPVGVVAENNEPVTEQAVSAEAAVVPESNAQSSKASSRQPNEVVDDKAGIGLDEVKSQLAKNESATPRAVEPEDFLSPPASAPSPPRARPGRSPLPVSAANLDSATSPAAPAPNPSLTGTKAGSSEQEDAAVVQASAAEPVTLATKPDSSLPVASEHASSHLLPTDESPVADRGRSADVSVEPVVPLKQESAPAEAAPVPAVQPAVAAPVMPALVPEPTSTSAQASGEEEFDMADYLRAMSEPPSEFVPDVYEPPAQATTETVQNVSPPVVEQAAAEDLVAVEQTYAPESVDSEVQEFDQQSQQDLEGEDETTLPRCPECSAFLEGNSRFCGECGYSLPERIPVCAACSSPLEPSAKFCGECGTPVAAATPEMQPGQQGWMGQMLKYLED